MITKIRLIIIFTFFGKISFSQSDIFHFPTNYKDLDCHINIDFNTYFYYPGSKDTLIFEEAAFHKNGLIKRYVKHNYDLAIEKISKKEIRIDFKLVDSDTFNISIINDSLFLFEKSNRNSVVICYNDSITYMKSMCDSGNYIDDCGLIRQFHYNKYGKLDSTVTFEKVDDYYSFNHKLIYTYDSLNRLVSEEFIHSDRMWPKSVEWLSYEENSNDYRTSFLGERYEYFENGLLKKHNNIKYIYTYNEDSNWTIKQAIMLGKKKKRNKKITTYYRIYIE